MTVKECYEAFGGSYDDVLGRLGKDERIAKYLKMFAAGNDYQLITDSLAEEKYEDAFRNVHNLKGVSLNLALTPLSSSSSTLCEELRHGKPNVDVAPMLADVKAAYDAVIAAVAQLN